MIRWAAIICASLSWLFAFQHYVVPTPLAQWGWIAAGWILGVFGLRRYVGRVEWSPAYLLLLVPLGVVLALCGTAYHPPLLVLALGVALLSLAALSPWLSWLQPAGLSAVLLGTVLLAQSPLYWAVGALSARSLEVPFLGQVVYPVLHWLGCDVSISGGTLYLRTMRSVHEFPLGWEHLGLLPLWSCWVAGVLVVGWRQRRRRLLGPLVALSWTMMAYAVARLVVLMTVFVSAMLFVEHEENIVHVEIFWMPWISALSWLPLIVLLAGAWRWPGHSGAGALSFAVWDRPARRWAGLLFGCVACAGAVLAVFFPDPGTAQGGRILLDESHSEWERTDNVYDTDWYGHESGYNYYCMAQYLDHFYELDFNMEEALTPERLSGYDVLVLKTPTKSYSDSELAAIEDFVLQGGGLFALGEHTNVFGSSVFLNPVVRRFGMAFRYDSVFDIERKWEQVHFPRHRLVRGSAGEILDLLKLRAQQRVLDYALEWSNPERQNALGPVNQRHEKNGKGIERLLEPRLVMRSFAGSHLGVHPIMQQAPYDRFAVSCSIASDFWNVRPVVRSSGLWALPIDYTAGNFYPNVEDRTDARFGILDQMVCAQAGRGRVVAFGDSTVYSNFLAFYPGKAEKLLGTINWLNRQNRYTQTTALGAGLAAAGALLFLAIRLLLLRPNLGYSAAVVSCCAAVVWSGLWACSALGQRWYAPPQAHTPVHTVMFDMQHSEYMNPDGEVGRASELPIFGFTTRYADSFEIFYQWILRLGYFTDVTFDLQAYLEQGHGPVVLLRPNRPMAPATLQALENFVRAGGSLLVLDAPSNTASTANTILAPFGLSVAGQRCRGAMITEPGSGATIGPLTAGVAVQGGTPLLTTSNQEPVLSFVRVGQGLVVAGGVAERFADTQMGGSSRSVPNRMQRAVYEAEFALMRGLVQGDIDAQFKALGEVYRTSSN